MAQKKDILKWFDRELTHKEIQDLKASDEIGFLEKIAHYGSQLKAPKIDADKAYLEFKNRNFDKKIVKVRKLNFNLFYKVAAAITLLLTTSYLLFFNNDEIFKTHLAETKNLTLPDNSSVILNSFSSLSYNKKNWDDKRTLDLDGEAFFKVHKGRKFIVNTTAGKIQVLGTQFNVKERKNYFEVQCYEGLVEVTYNKKSLRLTQGKKFLVIDGVVKVVDDFNSATPSWIEHESYFNKIPLINVIAELERHYDVKVSLNNIDTQQLFTGTFTHKDKNIALKSVTIPLNLSYKIEGKKVVVYAYENN